MRKDKIFQAEVVLSFELTHSAKSRKDFIKLVKESFLKQFNSKLEDNEIKNIIEVSKIAERK